MVRAHAQRKAVVFWGVVVACSLSCGTASGQQSSNARLIQAVKSGNLGAARRAILAGADVNTREARLTLPRLATMDRGGKPYLGDTPLILAIGRQSEQMVTLLMGKGADLNRRGLDGITPLSTAMNLGRVYLVRLLIHRGVDVNLHRKGEPTPVDQAQALGSFPIVRMLRAAGGTGSAKGGHWKVVQHGGSIQSQMEVFIKPRNGALTVEDWQVIESAAEDFFHHYASYLSWAKKGQDVVLADSTLGSQFVIVDEHIDGGLTDQQANEVTLEMRTELAARNGSTVSLTTMKPKNPRIHVRPEIKAQWERPSSQGIWMYVHLPAYSPRHDRAVLHFGSDGTWLTYFLVKRSGQWVVKWSGHWYND